METKPNKLYKKSQNIKGQTKQKLKPTKSIRVNRRWRKDTAHHVDDRPAINENVSKPESTIFLRKKPVKRHGRAPPISEEEPIEKPLKQKRPLQEIQPKNLFWRIYAQKKKGNRLQSIWKLCISTSLSRSRVSWNIEERRRRSNGVGINPR